ncbi:MAG: response regulator transcription factor [Candidatus Omnitrophica bacterium]|nr:response regulator transcription factor [Candidatus Omnitrophota bacterium]
MGKNKILIIDDEPDFAQLVKKRLEISGYEVAIAVNGNEGLKKIKTEKPDVVLLDILMPEKDGYTMLQEMKGDESISMTPVIVVTAKPFMQDLFAIEGINDYLIKPVDDGDLLLRIKLALERKV